MTPEELARAQARNLGWLVPVILVPIAVATAILTTIILYLG